MREKKREGVEKKAPTSFYDLRKSIDRLPTDQGLKSEYSVRATHGYQKLQVSPRFHAEGSGSRKFWVQEVFAELPRVVAHASRCWDSSYFDLFSILGSVWLSFNALRGCLALFVLRSCLAK